MTENGGSAEKRGSFGLGLLESSGVYAVGAMLLLLTAAATRHQPNGGGALAVLIVLVAFGFSLGLGIWHGTRHEGDTATGVVVGALLWPAIAFAVLVWAFFHALSHATIPF